MMCTHSDGEKRGWGSKLGGDKGGDMPIKKVGKSCLKSAE